MLRLEARRVELGWRAGRAVDREEVTGMHELKVKFAELLD
jgi:hypothetical protein